MNIDIKKKNLFLEKLHTRHLAKIVGLET